MNNSILSSLSLTPNLGIIATSAIASILTFIPRLIIALIIFFFGKVVANYVATISTKIFSALHLKQVVASFQLGLEMSPEFETGLIQLITLLVRYIIIYIGLIFALDVLGLTGIAAFLIGLVDFIPKILSALVILFIGVILAGFVETLIKKALIPFDPATARLGGKITSYTVVSFFGLMALGELGLAANFINTLFIGLVATLSLAFGLAIGLGAKDLVHDILDNWYHRRISFQKPTTSPKQN